MVKRTQLEKLKGARIADGMGREGALDRFGKGSAAPSRRELRKLDQAQGLVPFAVKLDGELVKQIQTLAAERKSSLNEVVSELLKKGLAG
jgi:hypothetical protein